MVNLANGHGGLPSGTSASGKKTDGAPVFYSVAKALEAHLFHGTSAGSEDTQRSCAGRTHPRVAGIVLDDFVLVQPAEVAVVQGLGQVPVVQGLEEAARLSVHPTIQSRTNLPQMG